MSTAIEYRIKPQKGISLNLKEIWAYKELFYFFTWRDIKVKYKQTALGFIWAVLQPFITMVIFTVFFGKLLNVPSENIPYPIFAYSGLIIWNIFASGMSGSGNSMVANANIIKKIYFPRLIIPMSSILVALFDFLMAFVIFIALMIFYNIEFQLVKMIIYIPGAIILTTVTAFGMGSFLAALNVKYRDFRYVIPFLIQSLMFLTPVIYPVSIIPYQWAKYIIALNPMSGAVNLARYAIIDKVFEIDMFLISCLSAIVLFFIGLAYFKKTEAYFADIA